MEIFLNLPKLFSLIKPFRYFVTKIDTPFFTEEFPEKYPIGRDVDIISHSDDFNAITQICEEVVQAPPNFSKHVIRDSSNHIRFRIHAPHYFIRPMSRPYDKLINGLPLTKLHFQVDVSNILEKDYQIFSNKFLDSLFENLQNRNGINILDTDKEVTLRILSWHNSPNSIHHLDYITQYGNWQILENFKDESFRNFCQNELEKII